MNHTTYSYIDLQSIKEDTFGDISILRMIIELFIEDIDNYVSSLSTELPRQNWKTLFQQTHKIKPNITMFGIHNLVEPILELETCLRNEENLDKVDSLVSIICKDLVCANKELQTELKSMPDE